MNKDQIKLAKILTLVQLLVEEIDDHKPSITPTKQLKEMA